MLSRFSTTTTFAYQNTIYFLRFQTIYYLFLILFYCFCIMFLCFFLSIYFFWLFLSCISFSKNNLYILHSKKRVPDATDFHSATSYPSLFSVATRIIIWYITTDSFIFPENSILCNTILLFYLFCWRYLFYGGVCYESLCDKKKSANTDPFRFHTVTMTAVYRIILRVYRCTGTVKWN